MFATLSAGAYHTCGITLNKTLLCWGKYPGNGQNPPYTAINVPTEPAWMRNKDTAYVAISAADGSTCALDIWSDIWCFGECVVQKKDASFLGDNVHHLMHMLAVFAHECRSLGSPQ